MNCNGYGRGVKYGLASMAFMVAKSGRCSRYELKINGSTFLLSLNTFFLDALNVITDYCEAGVQGKDERGGWSGPTGQHLDGCVLAAPDQQQG